MTTAIGLFRLDCFDKNKKEKKKSSLVPCGWWGREHHHALTLLQVLKYNIPPSQSRFLIEENTLF